MVVAWRKPSGDLSLVGRRPGRCGSGALPEQPGRSPARVASGNSWRLAPEDDNPSVDGDLDGPQCPVASRTQGAFDSFGQAVVFQALRKERGGRLGSVFSSVGCSFVGKIRSVADWAMDSTSLSSDEKLRVARNTIQVRRLPSFLSWRRQSGHSPTERSARRAWVGSPLRAAR